MVGCFAQYADRVDDADDGGIDGYTLQAIYLPGGAALHEEDYLSGPSPKRIYRDNRATPFQEFLRIVWVRKQGAEHGEPTTAKSILFLGRNDLAYNLGNKHGLASLFRCAAGCCRRLRKYGGKAFAWTSDHVGAQDFANRLGRFDTRFDGCLNRCYVAFDSDANHSATNILNRASDLHVRRLEHRVCSSDESGETFSFENSDCLFHNYNCFVFRVFRED